jgi:hypothetical protein
MSTIMQRTDHVSSRNRSRHLSPNLNHVVTASYNRNRKRGI